MLEDREGSLARGIAVESIRKRLDSTLFKEELAKRKMSLSGDEAFAAKG